MTNQFYFVGNQIVSSRDMPVPIFYFPTNSTVNNSPCINNQRSFSSPNDSQLCIEPTFLKLDIDDFVHTLEYYYYPSHVHEQNQSSISSTATSPPKVPSPPTPLFKCKWMKTLSNSSSSLQQVPQIDFHSIATQHQHVVEHVGNSPSSIESSSPNAIIPNSNNFNTIKQKQITGKPTNSKSKIQKKRNYQRVFHTIPPRNSCSEKKSGSWKFHLMDTEDDEECQSNFKFHIYTGRNNSNTSKSTDSNNSK